MQAYRGFESHPLRQKQEAPRLGRFLFLRKWLGESPLGLLDTSLCLALRASGAAAVRFGIRPPQLTNSPGANSDSPRLAPERAARRGEARGRAEHEFTRIEFGPDYSSQSSNTLSILHWPEHGTLHENHSDMASS